MNRPPEPPSQPESLLSRPIFRRIAESTKIGKKLLKPEERDYAENREFLEKSNAKIAKFFPDFKCSKYLIDIGDKNCLQVFQMVGRGAYYSFRHKNNMDTSLADVGFKDGNFFVLEFFSPKYKLLGFFIDLGDTAIETLDKNSARLANLKSYQLPKTNADLVSANAKLKDGIKLGNDILTAKVGLKLNTTYGLRLANWTDRYIGGEDKDLLIVLRPIRQNEDGSVIFIWRELQKRGTPKLKEAKNRRK